MKKMCLMAGLLLIMVGCSEEPEAEASAEAKEVPEVFVEMQGDDSRLTEYRHAETGCHYVKYQGFDLEQMFVEKDGHSVPYCD